MAMTTFVAPYSFRLHENQFRLQDGNGVLMLDGRVFVGGHDEMERVLQRLVDCLNALDKFQFDVSPAPTGVITEFINQRIPIIPAYVLRLAAEASEQNAELAAKTAKQTLAAIQALRAQTQLSADSAYTLNNNMVALTQQVAAEYAAMQLLAAQLQAKQDDAELAALNAKQSADLAASIVANFDPNTIGGIAGIYATTLYVNDRLNLLQQSIDSHSSSANNLADLTNIPVARQNLGLGTLATQNTNTVSISGGNIDSTVIGLTVPTTARFTRVNISGNDGSDRTLLTSMIARTINANPTRLTGDGAIAQPGNSLLIPTNSAYMLKIMVGAKQTGGTAGNITDSASWEIMCTLKRGATAGDIAFVGNNLVKLRICYDGNAVDWDVLVTPDLSNGSLSIVGVGEDAKNITWTATIIATLL